MFTVDSEKTFTENFAQALMHIIANVAINKYAEENYILNKIKNNDIVPLPKYLDDLKMHKLKNSLSISDIEGLMIKDGHITNTLIGNVYFDFYNCQLQRIFKNAPKFENETDNNDIDYYKNGLYKYLKTIYTIFENIININVPVKHKNKSLDISIINDADFAASNFISDIFIKKLRIGVCIDDYVKELPYKSEYISRLICKENEHYKLINNNINSLDYILALFSCFSFSTIDNKLLYLSKIMQWEQSYL